MNSRLVLKRQMQQRNGHTQAICCLERDSVRERHTFGHPLLGLSERGFKRHNDGIHRPARLLAQGRWSERLVIGGLIHWFSWIVLRNARTAKNAISSSSPSTASECSSSSSSSQGLSTCTHLFRYLRRACKSVFKSASISALLIRSTKRSPPVFECSDRRYVSMPETAVSIAAK